MTGAETWVTIVVALIGSGGLITGYVQHRKNQADARIAEKPDWAAFSKEMREALADERAEAAREAEYRDQRIAALQETLNIKDMAVQARDRHIDALKAQIWARQEPPPVEPPVPY